MILVRIIYGNQCSCHKSILNAKNLKENHGLDIDVRKILIDYDAAKDKQTRRRMEGEVRDLIIVVR